MHMFWVMIRLWINHHFLPHWMQDKEPDERHPYRRLFTDSHQRKRKIVKRIWMGAGLIVLSSPMLHILLIVALPATFLSFAILDETR
ncbi:hypothetical protein M3P05_14910 [Sansalvadorimonas sp. 2012CJ34-2]|uniref:Uncharacterized protein n=1 Tax=Parendozoicomonas callyspongiae TaxID=2942213 RepID=A0ABT0PIM9_9GAMM|nr:hypothetical protein [Sansalvadorimonas sp. 2012CJ34-2]MCL6271214.1 hypothetical protein [Sansalvadorimonas sp. 2012CJ34-2]